MRRPRLRELRSRSLAPGVHWVRCTSQRPSRHVPEREAQKRNRGSGNPELVPTAPDCREITPESSNKIPRNSKLSLLDSSQGPLRRRSTACTSRGIGAQKPYRSSKRIPPPYKTPKRHFVRTSKFIPEPGRPQWPRRPRSPGPARSGRPESAHKKKWSIGRRLLKFWGCCWGGFRGFRRAVPTQPMGCALSPKSRSPSSSSCRRSSKGRPWVPRYSWEKGTKNWAFWGRSAQLL